jgi:FixJ family two-component response regulator
MAFNEFSETEQQMAAERRFRLVADIRMPEVEGLELRQRLID